MMKRQRRILFAVLAVIVSMVMITGCATTAPTAAPSAAPTTAAPTTNAATAAPTSAAPTETPAPTVDPEIKDFVTMTWYIVGNGDEPDKDLVLKAVNDYLKPKINAAIDLRTIAWGDYNNKMNPMLAAGDNSFDLMFIAGWAANYVSNGSSGFLREITDLINKYGQDIVKSCGPDFLHGCQINGKQYAVPCNKEQAHAWGPLLLKSLVDKYQIDLTTLHSYKDLEPWFAKIKAGEPDVWPLEVVQMEAPYMDLDWDRLVDDNTPGALYPNNDASNNVAVDNFTAPESVAMYKQMRDYFEKGWINPDAPTQTDYSALMKTGKYFAIDQSLKPNKFVEMTGSTSQQWVQVAFSPAVMSNRETIGSLQAEPANGPNPERAMMFLNLLYSDASLLNMLDYGIKDTHYTVISGTVIDPMGGPNNKTKTPGFAPGNTWKFGDQFLEYITSADSPDVWQQYKDFNKSALVLNSLGFIFDGSKVQNELAATRAVVSKYYVNLFDGAGTESIDTIVANFDKELKSAGVDTLLKEETTQYQAWLATKK